MFGDILNHFISNIPLLAISSVMYFLAIRNIKIRRKESICFILFTSIVLLLSVVVEGETHSIKHGLLTVGTVFTALGYILRPILLFIFVLLADIGSKRNKKLYLIWVAPLTLNLLIHLFPLFFGVPGLSKVVFYYTQNAEGASPALLFHRGSFLAFTSHFISLCYLGLLVYITIKMFHGKHRADGIILLICVGIIIITVLVETLTGINDLLNIVCDICAMVNYIFIISINNSRDSLTGLYDRRTFTEDVVRHKNNINGIVQIDMNGLKYINDHSGHDAGDMALITLAKIFKDNIDKESMCAYRLSGDEFIILMYKGNKEKLENMIQAIQEKVDESQYSIAVGYYFINKELSPITVEEAMKVAEELMYVDKSRYYQHHNNDRRKE